MVVVLSRESHSLSKSLFYDPSVVLLFSSSFFVIALLPSRLAKVAFMSRFVIVHRPLMLSPVVSFSDWHVFYRPTPKLEQSL